MTGIYTREYLSPVFQGLEFDLPITDENSSVYPELNPMQRFLGEAFHCDTELASHLAWLISTGQETEVNIGDWNGRLNRSSPNFLMLKETGEVKIILAHSGIDHKAIEKSSEYQEEIKEVLEVEPIPMGNIRFPPQAVLVSGDIGWISNASGGVNVCTFERVRDLEDLSIEQPMGRALLYMIKILTENGYLCVSTYGIPLYPNEDFTKEVSI